VSLANPFARLLNLTINYQSTATPEQYYQYPSVTRYFDYIQTQPQVRLAVNSIVPTLSPVSFDIENAPKMTRTEEPPKKKERTPKAPADAAAAAVDAPNNAPATSEAGGNKARKKDKKEPNQKDEGTAPSLGSGKKAISKSGGGAVTELTGPVPSMIDLRVGHIIDGAEHVYLYFNHIQFLHSAKASRCRWSLRRGLSCASFCLLSTNSHFQANRHRRGDRSSDSCFRSC
jgi:hypothetical protein